MARSNEKTGYYFKTITDTSAFDTKCPKLSKPLNELQKIPSGSNWSTEELYAARLVIRAAKPDKTCDHVLPALRPYVDGVVRNQSAIRELLDGIRDHSLTETELVHRCGASLGSFWAALAEFGDIPSHWTETETERQTLRVEGDEEEEAANDAEADDDDHVYEQEEEGSAEKRPYSSGSSSSVLSRLPLRQGKRVKTARDIPNMANSASMQVGSSPSRASLKDPFQSQDSSVGYVGSTHGRSTSIPELSTVQIAASFIRHVLWACPPQHDTENEQPPFLVQFSGVPRQLMGAAGAARIHATADGELVLYKYRARPSIHEGEPMMNGDLLGQMTCEALALRLQLCQDENPGRLDENVFVIAAVRRYMSFLQFKIYDSYIEALTADDPAQKLTDYMELWTTQWFDLKNSSGRRDAVDNLVALVTRESALGDTE